MAKIRHVRVWDRFVRFLHWGLVATFAVAYFSTVGEQWVHNWSGYAAVALVLARIVWGFVGTPHARFADFVPSPRRLLAYSVALLRLREPRRIGHNPAAAVMILFLMFMVIAIGVTGWMLTLNAYFGSEMVEDLHVLLTDITLVAIAVHVAAAVYESLRHRENLVWSMVVGTKRTETEHGSGPEAVEVPISVPEPGVTLPADRGVAFTK
ncbi:MAG: cytochrome b/b6 domain-containing protein [Burkholderiaceae bacterium]